MKRLLNEILPEYSAQQINNASFKFSFKFLLSLIWLFSCTFLIYFLEIENSKKFHEVAIILTSAFLVYVFIPLKFRKIYLIALAFIIEVYLVGIKLSAGILILILYFIFLTYLKNKNLRSLLIIISTILCVLIFSKIIVVPFVRNVLLFGALFLMLRYIYLLYELKFSKKPFLFIDRLGYLFLFSNACLPLFPALDPKEYLNSFYGTPFLTTMHRALHNITVGIIHTLIYRIIYFYYSPSSYEIDGFWRWLNFILSSYALIFRLSGLFSLGFGFAELFGFKLRSVFEHYYFATGFTDVWRRINLNWREFMMRIFYYPFMFRFKKYNPVIVLFFCINIMFFVTWFLHSWQFYWIKGSGYFYLTDIFFWTILGFIVSIKSVSTYLEYNKSAAVKIQEDNYFMDAAKVIVVFLLMSVLWSLWTSSSLTEFLYIGTFAGKGTLSDYLFFFVGLTCLILLAWLIRYLHFKKKWFSFVFSEFRPIMGIVFCLLIYGVLQFLKAGNFKEEVSNFLSMNVNQKDRTTLERGYYDQLLNSEEKSIEMVNFGGKLTKWNIDNKAYVKTKNELTKEFMPNFKTVFKGDTLSTNSFGLRDKEYNLKRDSNVIRMAFLGGSYVMGSGVSNEENFAALLENELNDSVESKIEILNFAAGGYHLIQEVFITDNKLDKFKADYALYFIPSSDRMRCLDDFVILAMKDSNITYPFLKEIIDKAQLTKGMCRLEVYNKLKPFINDVVNWGYERIYNASKKNNTIPVIVYLPTNASLREDSDKEYCISLALKIGFHVIDLSGVYDGQIPKDIQLSDWDAHPNEKGHKLISDLLFKNLKKDKEFFKFMR